jgi:heat shock protein HslJ
VASLLAAYSGSSDEVERPGIPADLAGTQWVLVSLSGDRPIEDTSITLYFEETFLGGSMTCNGYGGSPDTGRYIATDDGALTLPGPLAVTVQLCLTPKGAMEQETSYIETLLKMARYRVADDRLEIDDVAGETILIFTAE